MVAFGSSVTAMLIWCSNSASVRARVSDFVGGGRENRGVTVALCESVRAMVDCLDSVRGTLGGLDDKGITQTLRDIEALSRRTHAVMLE